MSWFGGFLGGNARDTIIKGVGNVVGVDRGPTQPVDVLIEKLNNDSVTLEEKKQAINQLTNAKKDSYQLIGSKSQVLMKFFANHKNDIDMVRDVIEILTNIMLTSPKDDNIIPIHNTELFLNEKSNFVVVCDLLTIQDYYVRYYIARFFKTIIDNRFELVQESILSCPTSVTNIIGLLSDQREMIRNEILLVLLELTKTNQEIQKIVVFEGAFDIILDIIKKEGQSDGGIIVNDCIITLINLLKGNVSNQNYFRETGCIPRLSPLLQVQNTDMWILSENKFAIIMSTLDLVLTLVERNNLSTPPNQNQICQSGMMNLIIRLGLGKMSSHVIRSKALYTLGEVIHVHNENIVEFSSVSIKSELTGQSQSALLRMTQVILYRKELIEKISASHVFKCYLSNNEEAQMGLASTITPITTPTMPTPTTSASGQQLTQQQQQQALDEELSIGQHLVRALFSWVGGSKYDIASFWFASVVLCYTLKDSIHTKDQMLKTMVDMSNPPQTLFHKLVGSLLATKQQPDIDIMVRIGLLKILAFWLDASPRVAKELLSNSQYLPFIVESIQQPIGAPNPLNVHVQGLFALVLGQCVYYLGEESTAEKTNIQSIIHHRIGLNSFKDKLEQIRKTEAFTMAEQGEQECFNPNEDKLTISLYDFDFTLFFKDTCDKIRHLGSTTASKQRPGTRHPQPTVTTTTPVTISSPNISPPASSPNTPHVDRNTSATNVVPTTQQSNVLNSQLENENQQLKKKIEELEKSIQSITLQNQQQLTTQQQQMSQQQSQNQEQQQIEYLNSIIQEKVKENTMLTEAQTKLEDLVVEKDDKIEQLTEEISALKLNSGNNQQQQQQFNNPDPFGSNNNNGDGGDIFELMRLRQEAQDNQSMIKMMEQKVTELQNSITSLRSENQTLIQQRDEAIKKIVSSPKVESHSPPAGQSLVIAKLEGELAELRIRYSSLQKDQEELVDWTTKVEVENSQLKAQLNK